MFKLTILVALLEVASLYFSLSALAGDTSQLVDYSLKVKRGWIDYKNAGYKNGGNTQSSDAMERLSSGAKIRHRQGGEIKAFSTDVNLEVKCNSWRNIFLGWKSFTSESLRKDYNLSRLFCGSRNSPPINIGTNTFECSSLLKDVRLYNGLYPIVLSPRYTYVYQKNLKLTWMPVRNARKYEIILHASDSDTGIDDPIWREKVEKSKIYQGQDFGVATLSYPYQGEQLNPSKTYWFEVIAEVEGQNTKISSTREADLWRDEDFQECFKAKNGVSRTRFRYQVPELRLRNSIIKLFDREGKIQQDKVIDIIENMADHGFYAEALDMYHQYTMEHKHTPDDYLTLAWLYEKASLVIPECAMYRNLYYSSLGNPMLVRDKKFAEHKLKIFLGEDWLYQLEGGVCRFTR